MAVYFGVKGILDALRSDFPPIHLSDRLVLILYIEKSKSKNDGSNEPAGSTNISSTEYWESKFCSMKWPTR
jgi:hypothetical protein